MANLTTGELLTYLFGETTHPISARLGKRLAASPRFRAFVEAQRDKIRKKARGTADDEGLTDLHLELDVAHWLLRDRSCTVHYETYLAGKTRGPDFTVTFKGHTRFHVEVKRLRGSAAFAKWADAVCDKLGQLPTGSINVLLVAADARGRGALDAPSAMTRVQTLAERTDDAVFVRRGLHGARDYLRQAQRLSGVVGWSGWNAEADGWASLWLNRQAKHPIPPEIVRLLQA
jgi:hypothetical protein